MLFSIVKNPEISANDLNHDLDVIRQWAHQWKLEFNPDRTKQATEVLFSCKKSSPNHPQIMFNGTVVVKMNDQKHLGFTGAWQGSCRPKFYEELGWESLSGRRWCRRILQIHNKLPRLCRALYRQGNSNTFHELKWKSLRYSSSFFPDAITSWKMLLHSLMIFHLYMSLKNICYLWFVERKKVFMLYMIL